MGDKVRFLGDNRVMVQRAEGDASAPWMPFDCRAVLDVIMDALIFHDASGRIVHVNHSACAMFGYERHAFTSLVVEDLSANTSPYSAEEATRHAQTALAKGSDEFVWHSRRKNGDLFWSEVTLRRHHEGEATFVIAIVRDVTERKRIADALQESEEKLSKIFHGSSNAIALTELDSQRIVDVNRTWIAASGISHQEALGKTQLELGLWANSAELDACQRELRETGRARQREVVLSMAAGPQATLLSAETLALSSGTRVLWELRDVSALRRSEAATREREDRLRTISENFDSGMFYQLVATQDGDRRFTYVSDGARRLYGASPEAILADPMLVFGRHHPDDVDRLRQEEARAFASLSTFRAQVRVIEPSGQVRWSSVVSTPKAQPDGTVIWDGVELTITDLKRAEDERASLERQLLHAQRMESVGRLAGGVAHDFNNMLGVVLGQVELSKADLPDDHPLQANLDDIARVTQRSKELTSQLLAFARKQAILPRVLNLNEIVGGTLKLLQRLIGEDIRLTWRPDPNLWTVKMDASQLDQILTNVCVNARDAITGAGTVTIEVANHTFDKGPGTTYSDLGPGDYVRLAITDDGCGMDRETRMHIFEPFFTTKGVGLGTGLGLSTVYGIVRQNGGTISVQSEPGHGATFTIFLPRYRGPELPDQKAKGVDKPRAGNETVLLVEDEPGLLSMLSTFLRRSGYNVLPTSDPHEALRLAIQNAGSIRLLVSDVIMPGMNGRELAQRILAVVPGLPRLFMSGYTANVLDGQDTPANGMGFLQKPFSTSELAKMVRELIDTFPMAAP